ncbi:dynein regulatory complex subunit 5 [Esox lucius]|uniref:T-complex-associated-testis-expressed 1 n=1 Tax=Esox lucius TaxID=8010 RepID=A0A3P8Y8S7_ESOLU|nr:dynein regulatory complex subunit 5 [Esox lucius]
MTATISKAPWGGTYPPVAKLNLAADPRKMRRIIAEDPEWSLAVVPHLSNICLQHIVRNFEERPILDKLLPSHKDYVLERLSTSLPLRVTSNLISDEGYWKRCCQKRWGLRDVSAYGHSWKRMFHERHLENIIELFIPDVTDPRLVLDAVPLCRDYVTRLNISQLLPPIKEPQAQEEDDGRDSASDLSVQGPSVDHFDFGILLDKLSRLEELHVVYRVKGCGMNFEWNLFEFTYRDCELLARALKSCTTLRVLRIHQSKVDDEKCRLLVNNLLDHPSLRELNLSHNLVGDRGARAIGKLLTRSRLETLTVYDNNIQGPGARAIAHALAKNTSLLSLDLRLNRLGDEGGQAIAQALLKNCTLERLYLGANEMSEPTATVLSQVLVQNQMLRSISLACNRLGSDGGKVLEEGVSHNSMLLECDLRLTEVGQESEYCIRRVIQNNKNRERKTQDDSVM